MTTTLHLKHTDLAPLKDSSCHSYFLNKGLNTTILDTYTDAILSSISSYCPVLVFRSLENTPSILRFLPQQDKPVNHKNRGAYFFTNSIPSTCLIQSVCFFNDPIELLSFEQLHFPSPSTTLCLCLHPLTPISEIATFRSHFPFATFYSYIPNIQGQDILLNLKLSLALTGIDHSLTISNDIVTLALAKKTYHYPINQISKNSIPFVKDKKKQSLLFKTPPKQYSSYNALLNET